MIPPETVLETCEQRPAIPTKAIAGDLGVADVLSHTRPNPATRRHKAEKPVALLTDVLRMCANPGDVGFHPFAGSHNVIEACQAHGCHSVTVKMEQQQVAKAVGRFAAVNIADEVIS